MGIHNLLPFVKKACRQGHINEFAHQSIAVDVSCLLHRGLIGCADKVAQRCETDFYIRYVMKYLKALFANNCHVILVFDGQPLPAKRETNSTRRERRDLHKQRAELLMSEGRTGEAYDCFKRSASLTTEVIERTIQAFRQIDMVDVIVAPYESDAQLAFLAKTKMAQAVVTEDSDLIAFGCEKILFKMDATGSCVIFDQKLLPNCLCRALAENFDFDNFRRICILAGCDYLQTGLPGVGLNKAAAFFSKTSSKNLYQVLPRLPRYLNMNSLKVTKQFIADFVRAENTFLYQIVFDPVERRQRPLNDYPLSQQSQQCNENDSDFQSSSQKSADDLSYAGEIQSPDIAISLALGNIPGGSQAEQIHIPENAPDWSIWSSNYRNVEMRQKKKCNEEIKKKSSCGAFALTLSENFAKKAVKRSIEASRPPALHISNWSAVGSTTGSSSDNSDDFVTQKSANDLQKKPLTETLKSSETRTEFKRKVGFIHSIGATKNGNGARKNWNCDVLLNEFVTAPAIHEVPVKKTCCTANSNSTDKDLDASITPDMSKQANNASFCSKYFFNKGSKTSGLSRRSVSSLHVVPGISQSELSQGESEKNVSEEIHYFNGDSNYLKVKDNIPVKARKLESESMKFIS